MAQIAETQQDQRAIRNARILILSAIGAALIAAVAGLVMLIASPASGPTTEAALGFTAAIAGLATAAFAITAAIYAQVKILWRFAPTWNRVAAWIVIGIGPALMIWNLLDRGS